MSGHALQQKKNQVSETFTAAKETFVKLLKTFWIGIAYHFAKVAPWTFI